jgi:hypothetical protein
VTPGGTSKLVEIKKYNSMHTCNGVQHLGHRQISASFISQTVQARLQDQPTYRPKDIRQDIRREHGVIVMYQMAYRAKEQAIAKINGSHEAAFSELPTYCADLIRTNLGTTAIIRMQRG